MANPYHLNKLKEGVESWNQWRRENPDTIPDLSEAALNEAELNLRDLSRANLNRADLSRANLSRANLADATLRNAKFGRADLLNANLNGADLFGAILSNANLSGTDLTRAKLTRTELYGANLTQALLVDTDFDQAKVGVTTFANVDLSQAKNLETIRHSEPSTIGIDTILRLRGDIPEKFFRGCGVPEEIILYMRSLVRRPIEFYSCFISYSHVDESFAVCLHSALQRKGIRCWLDKHQLLPGDDIYDEIDRGVRLWDKVLLCASKSSLNSPWVDEEITTAFEQEELLWKENKKVRKLIPLDLDGYLFSGEWHNGKAAKIRSRFVADFTNWQADPAKFELQLERVLRALRSDGGGREAPLSTRL